MRIIRPSLGKVFAALSLLGAASVCCLLGAALMHFQLLGSDYLRNAFIGARAWKERGRTFGHYSTTALENKVTVDQPDQTSDGFTLYTTNGGPWAALVDMRGNVVHQWSMPFRQAWARPTHVDPIPENQYWFGVHLYPNGDLLAVYHGKSDTPYGYGLIKLDKDSKLVWTYAGHVHHEVDVAEDGTIYALTQTLAAKAPTGMDYIESPYIADALLVLSSRGEELDVIPILEALRDSPYASTLELTTRALQLKLHFNRKNPAVPLPSSGNLHGDFTHPNSVKVLREALAPKFPRFEAGQVLLSVRNMDALAVLDVKKRSVVWMAQGCWRRQHAADFLENGRLLLYDNSGAEVQTRVLEYDPVTQAIPWSYANEDSPIFRSESLGKTQRLPNGNTLIIHPDVSRIFEVTAGRKQVWESFCRGPFVDREKKIRINPHINSARRYPADQLVFLQGRARPRP